MSYERSEQNRGPEVYSRKEFWDNGPLGHRKAYFRERPQICQFAIEMNLFSFKLTAFINFLPLVLFMSGYLFTIGATFDDINSFSSDHTCVVTYEDSSSRVLSYIDSSDSKLVAPTQID